MSVLRAFPNYSATGNTLGVAQTVSATGDAELHLEGEEGGNMAAHVAMVESGKLNSKQKLVIYIYIN